ncbi:MAG TPA: DUF3786 domain-containing protein [Desulfobacterales bacterium]|nr:DUF3786 domain-containing protein [Desulfobacterales bacterium]
MPRIDDYLGALALVREQLTAEPFERIVARSGFEPADGSTLCVPFLNRVYRVSGTGFAFVDAAAAARDVPLQEQILILHYLMARSPAAVAGDWVAYRELPGAAFYFAAFVKRAIDPLKKAFGQNIAGLAAAAGRLMGRPVEPGDAGFEFRVFPKVPVRLILYAGDAEFAPEANILFDRSIGGMLSPEDIAWLSGMLVYRLIGLSS